MNMLQRIFIMTLPDVNNLEEAKRVIATLCRNHEQMADRLDRAVDQMQSLVTDKAQLADANVKLAQENRQLKSTHESQSHALDEFQQTVTQLQSQVAWLKKQLFGRKSERLALSPEPTLFAHLTSQPDLTPPQTPSAAETDTQTIIYKRRGPQRRGHRQPLPEDLPRVDRIHDLPEAEKAGMKRIGQEVSEQLAYEPGKVYVVRHVRLKYARIEQSVEPEAANVVLACRPEEGLSKCLAAPNLLAHIVTGKYGDSLPLHRLVKILKRSGVTLSASSMCRWIQELAALCGPLLGRIKQRILCSHVIQADETPVSQQIGGKGPTRTSYFWCYLGDKDHPYVLFDYQLTRGRAGPNQWFSDENEQPLYQGYLLADAYTGYGDLLDTDGPWQMTHCACWAHVRRHYYDVRMQWPQPCHYVLGLIKSLYQVERDARDQQPQERGALRAQRSRPVVDELLSWCDQQMASGLILPKSGLGQAVQYTQNQRVALQRYLNDGRVPIDNNDLERRLRCIAVGRKNWLFTGSEAGGRAAAAMFSLISSAVRNDVEPLAYLTDVFNHLPSTPLSQLDQFLPDNWQPRNA